MLRLRNGLVFLLLLVAAPGAAPQSQPDLEAELAPYRQPPHASFSGTLGWFESPPQAEGDAVLIRIRISSAPWQPPASAEPPAQPPGRSSRIFGPVPVHPFLFHGLVLRGPVGCGTVETPCPQVQGPARTQVFPWVPGQTLAEIPVLANVMFPRLTPGDYQIAAVFQETEPVIYRGHTSSKLSDPPRYRVTNALSFSLAGRTETDLRALVAKLEPVLAGPFEEPEDRFRWMAAAGQIARIETAFALETAIRSYMQRPAQNLLFALDSYPKETELCTLLQAAMEGEPGEVTEELARVFSQRCSGSASPATAATAVSEEERKFHVLAARAIAHPDDEKSMLDAMKIANASSWGDLEVEASGQYRQLVRSLAINLGRKSPEVLTEILRGASPGFVRAFGIDTLERLARGIAPTRCPDRYGIPHDFYLRHTAMSRLYAYDPERGRHVFREFIRARDPIVDNTLLEEIHLPESPIGDDEILGLFRENLPVECGRRLNAVHLANLYLSPAARERAEFPAARNFARLGFHGEKVYVCTEAGMRYLLRADPGRAERILRQHPWDPEAEPGPCVTEVLRRMSLEQSSPVAEQLALAYLRHNSPALRRDAAAGLARQGVLSAKPAILAAHERLRGETGSADPRFRDNYVGAKDREWNYVEAILRLWPTPEEINRMDGACLSEECHWVAEKAKRSLEADLALTVQCCSGGGVERGVAAGWIDSVRPTGEREILAYLRTKPGKGRVVLQVTGNVKGSERQKFEQRWLSLLSELGFVPEIASSR